MARVSIGLPVYNGERYLEDALKSIREQTFTDYELIISDNGSTDRTEEICRRYASIDPRIRYYREDVNRGATWNYNRLLDLTTAPYFKWAAHDDMIAPSYLEKCVEVLDRDPSVVVSHSDDQDIDAEGHPDESFRRGSHLPSFVRGMYDQPSLRFRRLMRDDHNVEQIFGVIRTDILKKTRLIQSYTDSDRTLLVELALYGKVHEVRERLFIHRHHPNTSVRANPVEKGWHMRAAWFDPALRGRVLWSRWRQLGEYLRMIALGPLSLKERILCLFWCAMFYRSKVKYLWREIVMGVGQEFQRRFGAQRAFQLSTNR
jgi:glycosyltransferase involved in cell wall biosynthesis